MTIHTVYIELSHTPIYRRIAQALGAALAQQGLQVMTVKPEGFDSNSFLQFMQQPHPGAAYISTASSNSIQARHPQTGSCYFEHFDGPLVFLHQDTILGGMDLLGGIAKLQAWQRVAARAAHLCIEADNIAELASLGIDNAALVPHATEFAPVEPALDGFIHDAAFVGHAIPSVHGVHYAPATSSQRLLRLLGNAVQDRREDFSRPLAPRVNAYVEESIDGLGTPADQAVLRIAQGQWLRNAITDQSLPLRGWVFEQCGIPSLDIYGGDPAYLHGVARRLEVQRPGVRSHAAVYETAELQRVFHHSRVNINISSLQFDHAVVNRFHDVTMSGGLCLTDARAGLPALTSAHAELSFRTLDDLRDRVAHFSRPENARQRALLIKAVQQDVTRNSGYPLLVQSMLHALHRH